MKTFLPPPVTPSDEEPIAAGGRQNETNEPLVHMNKFIPPLVTPSDEEPIATGGWYFLGEVE